jgi:hypothetical protein
VEVDVDDPSYRYVDVDVPSWRVEVDVDVSRSPTGCRARADDS